MQRFKFRCKKDIYIKDFFSIELHFLMHLALKIFQFLLAMHNSCDCSYVYFLRHMTGPETRVCNQKLIFLILNENICCGTEKNCLIETVLLSTQNTFKLK